MGEENLPNRQLRASDADRDRVVAVLGDALAEGRLSVEEHSQRTDKLNGAQTYADLEPLTADLPRQARQSAVDHRGGKSVDVPARVGPQVALVSASSARPMQPVTGRIQAIAILGGVTIDLRYTRPAEDSIDVEAVALFGAVEIVVVPEARVTVTGIGIRQPDEPGPVDGPAVVVHGTAIFGGVRVSRRPPADDQTDQPS